ncbi:thioredoxin [bacterium]|nr:thioredoxin [bacterium]
MSALKHYNDSNFSTEVESGSDVVLVDFYADWCAPCRILGPSVEELAEEYKGRVSVGKLNVDESPGVPMRLGIMGIPTLLFFKQGKLVDRVVGLVRKTELNRRLDSLLGQAG